MHKTLPSIPSTERRGEKESTGGRNVHLEIIHWFWIFFKDSIFHWTWSSLTWLGQWASRTHLSPPQPQCWDYRQASLCLDFYVNGGWTDDWTQFNMIVGQKLYWLSHLFSPLNCVLKDICFYGITNHVYHKYLREKYLWKETSNCVCVYIYISLENRV